LWIAEPVGKESNIMESQGQSLRNLMLLDREYFRLKNRLRDIPAELEKIEQHEAALRQALLAEEARLTDSQRERRRLETQIQDRQETKSRYERQLYEIRENRELQSLQREIEFIRQGLSELEEQAVAIMEQEESVEKELVTLREETKAKAQELEKKREILSKEREEATASTDGMEDSRKRLVESLPAPIRSKYQRLVNAKGQEAIVNLTDGSCGGCYYKLPPQTAAEIRMGDRLIVCEGCGRILVWKEGL
jgi:predicted  nucleic acid-binding Zn-ribbon protein